MTDFYNPRAAQEGIMPAMKKAHVATAFALVLTFPACLALCGAQPPSPSPTPKADLWSPLRKFIGDWEGDSKGEPGDGKAERSYAFTLNDRFIRIANKSTYRPQEKNPKGEVHEDLGFMSYDRAAKKFVLRQFHIEGFVAHYILESMSDDGRTFVFVSAAIENIGAGVRGRETYRFVNDDEFIETFELAAPGQEFTTYAQVRFQRK